ncbi:hypothetical protein BKA69DRAFT_499004 [Paraphysoderma sedebokerense]|nr:hypothetical protein BKA69DRAFT_499004 [Paraphysoderma sedebokerense]
MIEVPQSLMITEELALNSRRVLSVLQSCSSLFQNNGDQISSCALMLWLLEQKFNPSSEWKPYIDTLPEYYALPYYFSPEELSELKGTTAGSDLIRRYRDLIRYYTNFYKAIETDNIPLVPLHKFTFERFRWAFCTVLARQNQIRRLVNAKKDGKDVKREKWVMCLIPGFDNFNHADAELSNEFDESTGSLKVMASSDYKKGQQVYNSYTNSRSNAERLICSGFVAQRLNLPHDSFKIYLNVTGKTPLNFKPMAGLSKEDKELIAKRVKLLKEKFECDEQNVLPFSSPLKTQSKGLLVYLIANFATAEDLDRLEKELINMDSAKTDEKKEEKMEGEEKETEDSKSSKKRSKSASPSRKPKDEKATPKTPQEILDSNITTLTNLLVGSELSAKSTESVVNWLKTKLLVLERSLGEGTIEDLEGKAKKVKSEIGVLKGSGEVQAGDKDKEREILKLIWRKNVLGYKVTEKRLVGALKKEVEKLEKEIEAKKA